MLMKWPFELSEPRAHQVARSRSHLCTVSHKLGISYVHGGPGIGRGSDGHKFRASVESRFDVSFHISP